MLADRESRDRVLFAGLDQIVGGHFLRFGLLAQDLDGSPLRRQVREIDVHVCRMVDLECVYNLIAYGDGVTVYCGVQDDGNLTFLGQDSPSQRDQESQGQQGTQAKMVTPLGGTMVMRPSWNRHLACCCSFSASVHHIT